LLITALSSDNITARPFSLTVNKLDSDGSNLIYSVFSTINKPSPAIGLEFSILLFNNNNCSFYSSITRLRLLIFDWLLVTLFVNVISCSSYYSVFNSMLFTDSCRTITCSAVVSINNNFSLGINELPSTLSTLLDNSELVSYN
jgi:hypothetical protein